MENITADAVQTLQGNDGIGGLAAPINDWKSELSDDLKGLPALSKFQDTASLAKSYVNLEQMVGNSIRIPGENAGQEDLDKFYQKVTTVKGVVKLPSEGNAEELNSFYNLIGRPAAPEYYKLESEANIENVNAEVLNDFKKQAFDLGLTNKQADAVVSYQLQLEKQQIDAHNQAAAQAEQLLKSKWGEDYNNRLHGAKAALDMYAKDYPDAVAALLDSPVGVNPVILNVLSDLYGTFKEANALTGGSAIQYGKTPSAAREEIAEIRRNPDLMAILGNPGHPSHRDIFNKMEGLYKVATNNQQ